jgi:hypothetical protein
MKITTNLYKFLAPAPFLIAISFIFSIYEHNVNEIFPDELILPLIAALIFAVLSLALSRWLLKDKLKSVIFSSIFNILFFSYGSLVNLLGKYHLVKFNLDYVMFPIWLILIAASFLIIKKTHKDLVSVNKFILIVSVFAVLLPAIMTGQYELDSKFLLPTVKSSLVVPKIDPATFKNGLPDIYYIIPDSYASTGVLSSYFDSDSSAFLKYLSQKGFYVPANNTSNYPKTFLSVASTLNMEYLDPFSSHQESSDMTIISPWLNDNNVKKTLATLGYKYYQMGSWWDFTATNPEANGNFTPTVPAFEDFDFYYSILQSTMLEPFKMIGNTDWEKRELSLYQFNELPQVTELPGPKFVFAHILAPHLPYVFGKKCEFPTSVDRDENTEEVNYADQVDCTALELEATIDGILKNSKTPPIILIQSDEGVPFLRDWLPTEDEWGQASTDLIKEKFPVFSAYYLPGVATSSLPATTSNVNAFREIFNLYFSTNLPILPNKNFIFPDIQHPYKFIDVTSRVDSKP